MGETVPKLHPDTFNSILIRIANRGPPPFPHYSKDSRKSNKKPTQNADDKRILQEVRLEAFTTGPTSTVIALDLDPRDIEVAHKERLVAKLEAILSRLS